MQKKKTDAFVQGEYLFLLQGCAIHSEIITVIGVQYMFTAGGGTIYFAA